jgi:hypothetical protein
MKWLRNVGRGMNWDEHMDDYRKKIVEVRSLELLGLVIDKDAPPLFKLGSAWWFFSVNEAVPHHQYNV